MGLLGGWSPETWTAVGTLVLAGVTVSAVFVQEPFGCEQPTAAGAQPKTIEKRE
jgi:hypothetical protein